MIEESHRGADRSLPLVVREKARSFGHQLVHQFGGLWHHSVDQEAHAGNVASRSVETGDNVELDRVTAEAKDDWNCGRCGLSEDDDRLRATYEALAGFRFAVEHSQLNARVRTLGLA
jgi:hypothetical protein